MFALQAEGVGTDKDFECIGKIVDEAAAEANKARPAWLQSTGRFLNLMPILDPLKMRNAMRDEVKKKLSDGGYDYTKNPYAGARDFMMNGYRQALQPLLSQ